MLDSAPNKISVKNIILQDLPIIIYGYGYNGKALEKLISSLGYTNYSIVDDNEKKSGNVYSNIQDAGVDKNAVVFISISDSKVSAVIKDKCLSVGYNKVYLISEIDFRLELLEMGFKKVNQNTEYKADCPICGADSSQFFINMVDYELVKCHECEHIYVRNIDDINPICFYDNNIDYYRNIFYDALENFDSSNFVKPDSYIANRLELINYLLDTNIESDGGAKFLEIGCLDGRLLFYLKKLGLAVHGCEVNKPVAEYVRTILDIDIRTQELCECAFENDYFDYVFSSHVLEHLKDPVSEMALMAKLIRKNGKSIHHLPCDEDDYENTHHLHFFSKKSILKLHTRFFGNASHFITKAQRGDGSVYDVITVMSTKEN